MIMVHESDAGLSGIFSLSSNAWEKLLRNETENVSLMTPPDNNTHAYFFILSIIITIVMDKPWKSSQSLSYQNQRYGTPQVIIILPKHWFACHWSPGAQAEAEREARGKGSLEPWLLLQLEQWGE